MTFFKPVVQFLFGLLSITLVFNAHAKITLLDSVKFENTFISAYKEVEPTSKEKECYILLGNERFKLLIYPENIRADDTPLYVIYLDDMTVDTAYLMVDQNGMIRIDGLIFMEKRKYSLHRQLMAGNMLSMRTFDSESNTIDVTVPLKGYTRLTRKIEAACRKQ
ncbi:MAG: hypothetical protein OQL19_11125 [Gammaproteobacteria bacterium]|nr:hypothetical protein [Gammaproteobacteria bacterium]